MIASARARARTARIVCALAIAALSGCGGTAKHAAGPPKLPPVKKGALREFDAAMRALRLGGPERRQVATARFRKAVTIDPNLWEGWYDLGVLYYRAGKDEQAVSALGRSLAINSAHVQSHLARAEAYRRLGRNSAARADYEAVVHNKPGDVEAAARLASLLRDTGHYDDALDVVRNALRAAGASATLYLELGLIYHAEGRDELAALVLNKAQSIDPKNPDVENALALLALSRGDDQQAFERFDQATTFDPSYLDARFNKASVLMDAGDYAKAAVELRKVLATDPTDLDARNALGVAQRGLKKYDRAKATWERVVKSAPPNSRVRGDALWNLAVLQMDFYMNEKAAKAAVDRYLQEAPKNHPMRKKALERKKELGL